MGCCWHPDPTIVSSFDVCVHDVVVGWFKVALGLLYMRFLIGLGIIARTIATFCVHVVVGGRNDGLSKNGLSKNKWRVIVNE